MYTYVCKIRTVRTVGADYVMYVYKLFLLLLSLDEFAFCFFSLLWLDYVNTGHLICMH